MKTFPEDFCSRVIHDTSRLSVINSEKNPQYIIWIWKYYAMYSIMIDWLPYLFVACVAGSGVAGAGVTVAGVTDAGVAVAGIPVAGVAGAGVDVLV